jgi:pimeloyl-ACP methyl ester carboxylesterase
LDKLEIKNPILIGHSFGGSVIIKHLSSGESAKKAILISPSGIRKSGVKILFYKIIAKIFNLIFSLPGLNVWKDRLRRKFYEAIDSVDYIEAGRMTESYKKIIRDDLTEEMKKISVPVTLIWGAEDADTPISQGETMQKLIKHSKLRVIRNAGHFSFIDQPEEFKKIFLREINVY